MRLELDTSAILSKENKKERNLPRITFYTSMLLLCFSTERVKILLALLTLSNFLHVCLSVIENKGRFIEDVKEKKIRSN